MTEVSDPIFFPRKIEPRTYIQRFQDRGITLWQIADALKLSVRMICYMKKKNLEPRWSIGLAIIEFDVQNCSTATNQPSSIPQ